MSGLLLRKKNNKFRFLKDKSFLNKTITSYLFRDKYLPKDISLNILNKKNNCKKSSISKIKNKCLISGRNRAVYKKFKLSRMIIKNLGVSGFINGLRKSSW